MNDVLRNPDGNPATAGYNVHPAVFVASLALLLALVFQGHRGLWEPDEGRYTNVALTMLDTGDWLNPKRNLETGHWTKPPMTYWAIAASVATFGHTEFAARLPNAFAYLLCVLLAWRISRRLAPGTEYSAALIFATMLLPFGAVQVVTTDFLLTAFETLAVYGYIEGNGRRERAGRWFALMWAAFALAFLTKGPPALLPLLALLAHRFLVPSMAPRRAFWMSAPVFLVLALPWYIVVAVRHPGLLQYFLGAEVVDRVATDRFSRNGDWYDWLVVYGPTLLLGTMPWTAAAWRWARTLRARVRSWRDRHHREADSASLLLALWVLIPLLIFCVSRSRLPLYILPLFVPLAILAARQRKEEGISPPSMHFVAGWIAFLLLFKFGVAFWPTHKDSSVWAAEIRQRTQHPVSEVVFVDDMARYGLHLYLDAEIEKISILPEAGTTRFNPAYDESLAAELSEREADVVYITKTDQWTEVAQRIRAQGFSVDTLGEPFQERIIFKVRPGMNTVADDG